MNECTDECLSFTAKINADMIGVVDKDGKVVGLEPQNPTNIKVVERLFCKKCGSPYKEK